MQYSCDFSVQSCHINLRNRLQILLTNHFFSPFFLSLMYLYMYFASPLLSLFLPLPFPYQLRNIYVGYTYDNRVVDLRMPYFPLTFILPSICFFPAIFLETTSLLFRYHSVTTVSPSNTFPVPCPYPPLDSQISSTSSAATYQLQAHSADLQRSELPPVTRHLSCARR